MAVLLWLPSARKLAECRVPRNRILCKYPNQIHILKFNCFIRKFYLRGKARRELRQCLRRVLQTQPSLPELPPIFNLFPLKKPSTRRKHWKKKATGVGSGLVPVPVSTSSTVSVSASVSDSISLSSPSPCLAQHPGSSHPVRASGGAIAVFGLGLRLLSGGLGCWQYPHPPRGWLVLHIFTYHSSRARRGGQGKT